MNFSFSFLEAREEELGFKKGLEVAPAFFVSFCVKTKKSGLFGSVLFYFSNVGPVHSSFYIFGLKMLEPSLSHFKRSNGEQWA